MGIARLAGIMGAKKTADLIPLCHPLPITKVTVDLTPDPDLPGLRIEAMVKTTGKTFEQLSADMERDKFMTPDEAVAYGLADRIVKSRTEDNKE